MYESMAGLVPCGDYTFTDLLEDGPIVVDGLTIDVSVCIVVFRNGHDYEIDASSFGEKECRIITNSGDSVIIDREANPKFMRKIEAAIDAYALELAKELPLDSWPMVDPHFYVRP